MKLSTPFSTSPNPSTWPIIAHQTVAQILAQVTLVPRQYDNAEYCRNYCAQCPKGWGLTKARQASIWAFGGLTVIALGIAIEYLWRKCRGKSTLNRKETERKHAGQRVSNRDATIVRLQANITGLENDIQKAQKGKTTETASSSSHIASNDASPLNTTTTENERKGRGRDNDTILNPASDPTAVEMSPVETASKGESLTSGPLQENWDPLPDEPLFSGVASSPSHAPDEQSAEDPEPRKPVSERLDLVVRQTLSRRPGEARAQPLSTSRLPSDETRSRDRQPLSATNQPIVKSLITPQALVESSVVPRDSRNSTN